MKVPIQYKSSGRYNAGVDVIYDDESKLQYAPFIYASTESGDNGADEGGDEEGEDSMIVIYDETTHSIDKSFKELKDAVEDGKIVVLKHVILDDETGYNSRLYYLTNLNNENAGVYYAFFSTVYADDESHELYVHQFEADNEMAQMTLVQAG